MRDALDAAVRAWAKEGKGDGRISGKTAMNIWSALTSVPFGVLPASLVSGSPGPVPPVGMDAVDRAIANLLADALPDVPVRVDENAKRSAAEGVDEHDASAVAAAEVEHLRTIAGPATPDDGVDALQGDLPNPRERSATAGLYEGSIQVLGDPVDAASFWRNFGETEKGFLFFAS